MHSEKAQVNNKEANSTLNFLNENGTRFYQSDWNLVPYFMRFLDDPVNISWFEAPPFIVVIFIQRSVELLA